VAVMVTGLPPTVWTISRLPKGDEPLKVCTFPFGETIILVTVAPNAEEQMRRRRSFLIRLLWCCVCEDQVRPARLNLPPVGELSFGWNDGRVSGSCGSSRC